jgi:hypothetical protein
MLKYTCDICDVEAVSSHRVERYQLALELCSPHLKSWLEHENMELGLNPINDQDATGLSRAVMDILVAQHSRGEITEQEGGVKAQTINSQNGITALHKIVDAFIAEQKAMISTAPQA